MVKKRFIFLGSVLLHGLLAASIGYYVTSSKHSASKSFSVVWINSSNKFCALTKVGIVENSSSLQKPDYKKRQSTKFTTNASSDQPAVEVIYNPAPIYPAQAKRDGVESSFLVKIFVKESGVVESIEIITVKGEKEIFEEAIITALKTWRFKTENRKASFEVPISFQLE